MAVAFGCSCFGLLVCQLGCLGLLEIAWFTHFFSISGFMVLRLSRFLGPAQSGAQWRSQEESCRGVLWESSCKMHSDPDEGPFHPGIEWIKYKLRCHAMCLAEEAFGL